MAENKIPLNIAGLSLVITTDEDEGYVKDISEEINADISAILEANPGASITSAGLLCALDYLDNCKKATKSANSLRSQIKDYLADAANAKMMFDEERKRTGELDSELQALRSHLTRLASDADTSGALERLKSELSDSSAELTRVRKQAAQSAAQGKALAEKASAMSDYISSQDREIERLNLALAEQDKKLAASQEEASLLTEQLKHRDERLNELQLEADRLASENDALRADCADKDDIIDKLKAVALDKIAAMKNSAETKAKEADAPFEAAPSDSSGHEGGARQADEPALKPTAADGGPYRAQEQGEADSPKSRAEAAGDPSPTDGAPPADDPFSGMKIEPADLTLGFEGSASSMDVPLEEIPLPESHLQKLEEQVQRAEEELASPGPEYVFDDDITDIMDTREPLSENPQDEPDNRTQPRVHVSERDFAQPESDRVPGTRRGRADVRDFGDSDFTEAFAPKGDKKAEKRGMFTKRGRAKSGAADRGDGSDDAPIKRAPDGGDLLMREPVNLEDIIETLDDEDDMPNLSWIKDIN